jgi:hypothetical protein
MVPYLSLSLSLSVNHTYFHTGFNKQNLTVKTYDREFHFRKSPFSGVTYILEM